MSGICGVAGLGALMLVAGWGVLGVSPSQACGNAVYFEANETLREIAQAERALRKDRTGGAFKKVMQVVSHLEDDEIEFESSYQKKLAQRFLTRARFVAALATVRLDGNVNRYVGLTLKKAAPETRKANVLWALEILAELAKKRPDDPRFKAAHAEALAWFPEHHQEALKRLKALDDRDLIPDAWTYRALSALATRLEDSARAQSAAHKCTQRAGKRRARRCARAQAPKTS